MRKLGPRGVLVRADSWELGQEACDPGPGALTSGQEGWLQLVRKLESFLGRMASERWERMEIICPLRGCHLYQDYFICIFLWWWVWFQPICIL